MALVIDYPRWFAIHKLVSIADWEELLRSCNWDSTLRAPEFHQRLSATRPVWAVVEKNYVEKDYRSIYTYHYSKVFADYNRFVHRVHFWDKEIAGPGFALDVDQYAESYVGFSCLFNNEFPAVGRSIWDSNKVVPSARVIRADFEVNLYGARLHAKGFPFIQQDTNVMACAQASVWMVLRYFSEKYSYYRDVFPHEIALAPLIHGFGRAVPSAGLAAWEICDIISRFGFHPENHSLKAYASEGETDRFLEVLHRYLESGIPVVLGSEAKHHAIVAVGVGEKKTAFSGTPVTRSGITYIPAWRYFDSIIVNDDNLLPYSMVNDSGGSINLPEVDSLIVPLYEKIYLSGRDAENVGLGILANADVGIQVIGNKLGFTSQFLANGPLVIRTILTSSRSFRRHHQQHGAGKTSSTVYRLETMPKFVWIVEVSNDTLFKQGQKFAEIVIDATSSKRASLPFLFIRYPGLLIRNAGKDGRLEWDLSSENPVEDVYENLK